MLPKLYEIAHPRTPFQVVFTTPTGKRVRRHFAKRDDAEKHHRQLSQKAKVAGTAGLVLDAEMRAEYFAARRMLGGVPLLDAVRYYVRHNPAGGPNVALVDALEDFLEDKRRAGRSDRTVRNLSGRLRQFMAASDATRARDFTSESVAQFLQLAKGGAVTQRNHRAALSVFGAWLARKKLIPENPVKGTDSVRYDQGVPAILTPLDAEKVMRRAVEHRVGFSPSFLLYRSLPVCGREKLSG